MAQATIGVYMNEGTDVAKSAGDVVLMRSSLAGILTTNFCKQEIVQQGYVQLWLERRLQPMCHLTGAGAFVNFRIPPEFAGLGELVSVLPVTAAAVLLRWSKIKFNRATFGSRF